MGAVRTGATPWRAPAASAGTATARMTAVAPATHRYVAGRDRPPPTAGRGSGAARAGRAARANRFSRASSMCTTVRPAPRTASARAVASAGAPPTVSGASSSTIPAILEIASATSSATRRGSPSRGMATT